MDNIIDFKSMVAKLQKIDPTSFEDMKKQIVESVQTSPEAPAIAPVSDLRKLSGLAEMSKKSIKKAHSTADKIKDKPKAKKSISKWSKGKFDDPESAIYAIATNMQKRKDKRLQELAAEVRYAAFVEGRMHRTLDTSDLGELEVQRPFATVSLLAIDSRGDAR